MTSGSSDARDHLERPAAAPAALDIDSEDTLEALRPRLAQHVQIGAGFAAGKGNRRPAASNRQAPSRRTQLQEHPFQLGARHQRSANADRGAAAVGLASHSVGRFSSVGREEKLSSHACDAAASVVVAVNTRLAPSG
jgi:hypothetical protein